MSTEALINCENLVKIYHLEGEGKQHGAAMEIQALQGLDLSVASGEMLGVVGASGSGKSTLLNILGGLDRPTGGRAVVDGKDLGRISQLELDRYRRRMVGFVWQQAARNLIPYLTALENIRVPLTIAGQMGAKIQQHPKELLRLVGLEERANHRLEELSGGEQQRIAIAIALANQPRLLLADEPTGELDSETAQAIYDLMRELNRKLGLTAVIVSHDPGISRYVDRVVAVRDGKLASETLRLKSEYSAHTDGAMHLEERIVLDSAGRLQIPREHLERFNIHRRARLEITDQGILIRPPVNERGNAPAGVAQEYFLPAIDTQSAGEVDATLKHAGISRAGMLSSSNRLRSWLGRFKAGKQNSPPQQPEDEHRGDAG